MKVLVIGGSGFLSGTVVRAALAAGHETWAISRGNKPVAPGAHALLADRKERAGFADTVRGAGVAWDLVVDCIGFNADDARQDVEVFAGRARQLVFISTDCVFSGIERPWQVDEAYASFTSAPYGANKRAAEEVLLACDSGRLGITILRPCHILGPGSQLGCLPHHGRDPRLLERMRAGETLRLIGGGLLLQQPIFAPDLAGMILSCAGNSATAGQIYMAAGPEVVESAAYYRTIAGVLGVELRVEETSIAEFLTANPTMDSFCCHRAYGMEKPRAHGLAVPATPLADGLRIHVESLMQP